MATKKHKSKGAHKVIAENRRARFEYEILEIYECGLSLLGAEVKSAKGGGMNLTGSYVAFQGDRPILLGARISPYAHSSRELDPERTRPLLLNRSEIDHLRGRVESAGLTLIPLRAYLKRGLVKLEIGLARGKKATDKRSVIRERDVARDAERELTERTKGERR
jgi:SsrA-binding protein